MCPCKVCFPNDEPCVIKCSEKHVSCPLIEAKLSNNHVPDISNSFTNVNSTLERKNQNKDVNILQQPTYLPNLTDIYTKKAIEIMATNIALDKPFFLYLAYHQTHHPQFAGKNVNKGFLSDIRK